eukprot:CAMPEP_0118916032 /NCGR_PEP_ID=MMETSP1166-20130328/16119_1 /TAXON_ID=1104430 /ORGANISM="Chrysoreinhardia sp, Strain CCMP3193" /LENGTH=221 /DNA_ID=CAMNT_0006855823 /DNA_START=64 /DNA_END=726 /DNA_ORIENTATION=+
MSQRKGLRSALDEASEETRSVGAVLVAEAINLCPCEDAAGAALYGTYSDVVRLAQTSSLCVALINWIKVARFAVNELSPRRRLPQPLATFPLSPARLPTRISSSAVAALSGKAKLDAAATEALRTVASGLATASWGSSRYGERNDAPTCAGFVAIACGHFHSVALRDDGTVGTWGCRSDDQRDDAPTCAGFVAIACGYGHSVALRDDGTVVTWGRRSEGQR